MPEQDWLAQQFEAHRAHLRGVALRMLGSTAEADDAVQEAWIRLHRSGASEIDNLGGWLTTVVSRVSLDMLRARASRREDPTNDDRIERVAGRLDPEHDAVLADSVGAALLVVLDTLAPAERLVFVLHDLFAVPFEEIAPIVGRSTDATKMLASRARRKVQGKGGDVEVNDARQRSVVDAFLAASRNGDFDALVALLDADAAVVADAVAVRMGAPERVSGASAVAQMFCGRAQGAEAAIVDGAVGWVWMVGRRPKVVWDVAVQHGKIVHIDMLASPDTLQMLEISARDA